IPPPRSSAMVGSEMLTMLPLRVLMKAPTDTAESTSHFPLFGEEACPDVTLSSFPVRTSEPASTRSPIPLRSRLRCPFTNYTRPCEQQRAREAYQGHTCLVRRHEDESGREGGAGAGGGAAYGVVITGRAAGRLRARGG